MSTPNHINAIHTVGRKYIDAVNAYLENKIDKESLLDIQAEFSELLNDLAHYEMTIILTKTSQHIQHELNSLLSLADRIDDHHLNKAIINAEKALEEIGEIGEINYVAK